MIIWWIFAGLVVGILGADIFPSLTTGWICFSLGLILFFLTATKKAAAFTVFLGIGIIITVLRWDMLYEPIDLYGEVTDITLNSYQLVQVGDDYAAWKGRVVEPENLAGATVLVYSQDYRPGLYVLSGRLLPPVQYRNPGQEWHYKRKIYSGEIGVLNRPDVTRFWEQKARGIELIRNRFRSNLVENLGDASGLALAITTGDRSLMSGELKSAVYLTGVGHIMALSGLHVSILAGLIMALMRKIGLQQWFSGLMAVLFLLVYVAFVGPSPSLIRAVLMSAYAVAAFLVGKEQLGLPALAWSGLAMLLFNPLWAFDYAFVFSFAATYVCLVAGKRLERFLSFLPNPISRVASVTLIIQITALPLTLYLFGSFSLWAPLANVVIIPLMPIMAGSSFLSGLIGKAGTFLSLPPRLLLNGVAEFVKLLNQFPIHLELGRVHLALAAAASCCLLMYFSGASKKITAVIMVICIALVPIYTALEEQICSVWFLDVGQGDAILIRIQGKWVLIDCGEIYAGDRAVVSTLKFLGVDRLTALIITHPHSDHVGGLLPIMDKFPIDKVYVDSSFQKSEWLSALEEYDVVRGEVQICPGIKTYSHNLDLTNLNDNSLLTTLEFNGTKILFTGDIEEDGERLYWGKLGVHDILKVAHHGSQTSTSLDFLEKIQAETAVISCGMGNRFGFPNQITLENLENAGVSTYRTDLSGCVHMVIWPWTGYTIFTFMGR